MTIFIIQKAAALGGSSDRIDIDIGVVIALAFYGNGGRPFRFASPRGDMLDCLATITLFIFLYIGTIVKDIIVLVTGRSSWLGYPGE
jgi:hypothetical protein